MKLDFPNLATFNYVYDVLITLGSAKDNELPLNKLSRFVDLSPQRLQSHLDLYLYSSVPESLLEQCLFKKFMKPTGLKLLRNFLAKVFGLKLKDQELYYKLTKEGLKIYKGLPYYTKMKNSLAMKVLKTLTGASHPRLILKRLSIILCVGTVVSSSISSLPYGLIIAKSWLFIALLIMALLLLKVFKPP